MQITSWCAHRDAWRRHFGVLIQLEADILAHAQGVKESAILEHHAQLQLLCKCWVVCQEAMPRLPKNPDLTLQCMQEV